MGASRRNYVSEIKEVEWIRFFTRGHHPLLYVDSVMRAHRDILHSYFGLPRIRHWVRHSGALWVDRNEMNRIYARIRGKLFTNWPLQVAAKMERDLEALNRFASQNRLRYSVANLKEAYKLIYPAWLATYFPIIIGKVIENEVTELARGMTTAEREQVGRLLNSPLHPSIQQKYAAALQRLGRRPSIGDIRRIIERFRWIKGYVMDVRILTRSDVLRDAAQQTRMRAHGSKEGRLTLSPKLRKLIVLGRLYCWFRDWRLFQITKFYWLYKPMFEWRARELGLSYQQLCQLTTDELFSGDFQRSSIRERQREFSILLLNRDVLVKTGSDLRKVKKYIAEKINHSKVVKGITVSQGKVIGRVRIADSYNFSKVKKGEVVVAAETTPDAVPYLRGVKAIITDEGGITSHAAIISRELHIPCIIGTHIATKSFKNGDIVEVDANLGVVRKL